MVNKLRDSSPNTAKALPCKQWRQCLREKINATSMHRCNHPSTLRTSSVKSGQASNSTRRLRQVSLEAGVVATSFTKPWLRRINRSRLGTNLQHGNSVRTQVRAWVCSLRMISSTLYPFLVFNHRISQSISLRKRGNSPSQNRNRKSLTSQHSQISPRTLPRK